jgi:hypothetical protein
MMSKADAEWYKEQERLYREDLAVLRFWRRQMKTNEAKRALDKVMYFVIVNHHRALY